MSDDYRTLVHRIVQKPTTLTTIAGPVPRAKVDDLFAQDPQSLTFSDLWYLLEGDFVGESLYFLPYAFDYLQQPGRPEPAILASVVIGRAYFHQKRFINLGIWDETIDELILVFRTCIAQFACEHQAKVSFAKAPYFGVVVDRNLRNEYLGDVLDLGLNYDGRRFFDLILNRELSPVTGHAQSAHFLDIMLEANGAPYFPYEFLKEPALRTLVNDAELVRAHWENARPFIQAECSKAYAERVESIVNAL